MKKKTQRNILIILGFAFLLGFLLTSCDNNKCPGVNDGSANWGDCETAVDEKGFLMIDAYCNNFDCSARKLAMNYAGLKAVRQTCSCN